MHPVLAALKQAYLERDGIDPKVFDRAQEILDNGCGQHTNFQSFWTIYPRKVGKPAAFRAWVTVDGDKHWELIRANINSRLASKQWERTPERVQYIPHPTTYLNQRRWLDEGLPVSAGGWNDV